MKKSLLLKFLIVGVFCATILAGFGLSSLAAPKDAMKAPEVQLVSVENLFLGKESVVLAPQYEIRNPNNFPIIIDQFSYNVSVKGFYGDGNNVPLGYYLPAKSKIPLSVNAFALTWANMGLAVWQQTGAPMGEAVKQIVPLWKNLNGQLFNPAFQEAWDKIPKENPEFTSDGEVLVIGPDKQSKVFKFATVWKLPAEYDLYK